MNLRPLALLAFFPLLAQAHDCTVVCEDPVGFQNIQQVYTGNVIAGDPSVIPTATGYMMTYTDGDLDPLSNAMIGIATSPDGINWTPSNTPDPDPGILIRGRTADEAVETSAILDIGPFRMLYVTTYYTPVGDYTIPGYFIPAEMYFLSSTDNLTANWHPNPVIENQPGWYTNDGVYAADVIWDVDRFVMAYNAFCYFDCSGIPEDGGGFIMIAESTDGIVWNQYQTPTISPGDGPQWMAGDIKTPSLVKYGNEYLMFFLADDDADPANTSLGLAYADSLTGPWTVVQTPILQPEPGTFYSYQVQAPSVIMNGGTVMMWFMAASDPNTISVGYGEADIENLR